MTRKLIQSAFIMAIIVVTLGALTRLLDAGLGCPDWPGCYGQVTPPTTEENQLVDSGKAWMEMIHRYVASLLGLMILIAAIVAYRDDTITPKAKSIAQLLLVLVIIQGLFGMWTVTLQLLPQVVTLHLLGGMTVLATTFWLMLHLNQTATPDILHKPKFFSSLALIALVCQIALGGWTSSTYSGLACTDFPTCDGQLLPQLEFSQAYNLTDFAEKNYEGGVMDSTARITIQYTHRVMAVIVTIIILTLYFKLRQITAFKVTSRILLFSLLLQLGLGISAATMMLPLSIALLHNSGAALLLLVIVYINYLLFSNRQDNLYSTFIR